MKKPKSVFFLNKSYLRDNPITCLKQNQRVHLLEFEPFNNTFGPKAQRKKPQLATCDIQVNFINIKLLFNK